MKYFTCFITLFVVSLSVTAQVRFGARAGIGVAGVATRTSPGVQNEMRLGYSAGLLADIPISHRFSIQPAVLFAGKGTRVNASLLSGTTGTLIDKLIYDFRVLYVEVPVMAVLRHEISNTVRVYVGAGAYTGIGVGGRYHIYTNSIGAINEEGAIRYGSGRGGTFRRLDYGGCAAVGVERRNLQFSANYTLGMPDVSRQLGVGKLVSRNNARNSTLNLAIGFLINSEKIRTSDAYFEKK